MNPPKNKGRETQSKEARAAGMSQKKYESTRLNQAFLKSLNEKYQSTRTNVRTQENIARKNQGSLKK